MMEIIEALLNHYANYWQLANNLPPKFYVQFVTRDTAVFTYIGKSWHVGIWNLDFETNVPGALGFNMAFMQAMHASEEYECVKDMLMAAGYIEIDRLHDGWLTFSSPDGDWVDIFPDTMNKDPRGRWGVYSPNDDVRRFVRTACEQVRGEGRVI